MEIPVGWVQVTAGPVRVGDKVWLADEWIEINGYNDKHGVKGGQDVKKVTATVIRNASSVPEGYELIFEGTLRADDLCQNLMTSEWEPHFERFIGCDVQRVCMVARKK